MNASRSILLVEDDADDVFFVSRAIQASGLNITTHVVNDGAAAIEFFEKARVGNGSAAPSLVLLDLNIPHKSGLEVLRWLRAQPELRLVIVIVLTSSTSEADIQQAYTLGANSYLIKPVDATRLNEIGRFLKEYWFGWNQLPQVGNGLAKSPLA